MSNLGRPTIYSSELAFEICARLAEGNSLRKICESPDMPSLRTVLRWSLDPKMDFCHQYFRAKEFQADLIAEDIISVADAAIDQQTAAAARVRIDARKWVASKLRPKRYGEMAVQDSGEGHSERDPEYPAMTPEMARELLASRKF